MCGLSSVLMSMGSWFHHLGARTGNSGDFVACLAARENKPIGRCRAEWTGWGVRFDHVLDGDWTRSQSTDWIVNLSHKL